MAGRLSINMTLIAPLSVSIPLITDLVAFPPRISLFPCPWNLGCSCDLLSPIQNVVKVTIASSESRL